MTEQAAAWSFSPLNPHFELSPQPEEDVERLVRGHPETVPPAVTRLESHEGHVAEIPRVLLGFKGDGLCVTRSGMMGEGIKGGGVKGRDMGTL